MAAWLPNFTRVPLPGVPGKAYQFTHNPKVCWHTTEGGSIAGARSAYAPYPPHLIYDARYRVGEQHIPITLAAYSAMDGNDDDYMIQVELVGFAGETRNWPDWMLYNIATDVVLPLEEHFGVPRNIVWKQWLDDKDGVTIASANSPLRLSWQELRDFSGHLAHQHLPSPDNHWDAGRLNIGRILEFAGGDNMALTDGDANKILMAPVRNALNVDGKEEIHPFAEWFTEDIDRNVRIERKQIVQDAKLEAILKGVTDGDGVDEDRLNATVKEGVQEATERVINFSVVPQLKAVLKEVLGDDNAALAAEIVAQTGAALRSVAK
jgi:hypothetical protein